MGSSQQSGSDLDKRYTTQHMIDYKTAVSIMQVLYIDDMPISMRAGVGSNNAACSHECEGGSVCITLAQCKTC